MKKVVFMIIAAGAAVALYAMNNKGMPVETGDQAPQFNLPDQEGKMHSLDDYKGQKVVLYFYPKDDTPGCTKEACSFRDGYQQLQDAGIVILGVSYDSPESHRQFREKYNLPFNLLSDSDKTAAKAYGAYRPVAAKRYTYLINEDGKIVHIFKEVDVSQHAEEVLQAFAAAENSPQGQSVKNRQQETSGKE
ncbi:MAG: peroxiredoxin [Calditrichia bacterium]